MKNQSLVREWIKQLEIENPEEVKVTLTPQLIREASRFKFQRSTRLGSFGMSHHKNS